MQEKSTHVSDLGHTLVYYLDDPLELDPVEVLNCLAEVFLLLKGKDFFIRESLHFLLFAKLLQPRFPILACAGS